jgi:AcrR family transcriptional regulator
MSENSKTLKPRGRPRSRQSHQAMLQATLALLAEVGFEAMSIDGIAARAGVGKTTIYRRYASKAELVADAIESVREEIVIPDTGRLQSDLEALIYNAAQITLTPLGRQTVAMIISSATSNAQFAQIYWQKYLHPRRKAFAIILERAKSRQEISADLDSDLVFDTMSGIMLYALIFQPAAEQEGISDVCDTVQRTTQAWSDYVLRALSLLLKNAPKA